MDERPLFRDEMLVCQRCGIAFLWSSEEQRRQARSDQPEEPPSLCPGCRRLLPPPGYERGLVKWYNHRKRYGFIIRQDGSEIFTHRSHFAAATGLRPGDLVEFRVETGEQGPMAVDVRLLQRADDQG